MCIVSNKIKLCACETKQVEKLQHQENDVLELHFAIKPNAEIVQGILPGYGSYLEYTFKFKKGKWKQTEYDSFETNFDEIQKGKMLRPFSK